MGEHKSKIDTSLNLSPLPNPTPKLTAELKEQLSALFDRPVTDDDVIGLRLLGVVEERVAIATRKAFKEAEEKAPELVRLIRNEGVFAGPYASGYDTVDEAESVAVEVLAEALRALAKEQAK